MHFDMMRFWDGSKEQCSGIWGSGERTGEWERLEEVNETEEEEVDERESSKSTPTTLYLHIIRDQAACTSTGITTAIFYYTKC